MRLMTAVNDAIVVTQQQLRWGPHPWSLIAVGGCQRNAVVAAHLSRRAPRSGHNWKHPTYEGKAWI